MWETKLVGLRVSEAQRLPVVDSLERLSRSKQGQSIVRWSIVVLRNDIVTLNRSYMNRSYGKLPYLELGDLPIELAPRVLNLDVDVGHDEKGGGHYETGEGGSDEGGRLDLHTAKGGDHLLRNGISLDENTPNKRRGRSCSENYLDILRAFTKASNRRLKSWKRRRERYQA